MFWKTSNRQEVEHCSTAGGWGAKLQLNINNLVAMEMEQYHFCSL